MAKPKTRPNPIAPSAIVGLVAAVTGLGVGIYLLVEGAKQTTLAQKSVPQAPPLPNFYKGPGGQILQAVGPYGVPLEVTTA